MSKPVDFSKILEHPVADEIVSKLISGVKPKAVSDWLKMKYPDSDQGHLRLNEKLLKEFIENNVNLYNDIEKDIQAVKNGEKVDNKIAKSLLNNKTYQERINEIIDSEIDIKKAFFEQIVIIKARIEQIFDHIQSSGAAPTKSDYNLHKYLEILMKAYEVVEKITTNRPDQVIQQNINVHVVQENVSMIQDVVMEILYEMDPALVPTFLEKMTTKMNKLNPPTPAPMLTQEDKAAQIQMLTAKIEKIKDK